MISLRNAVAAGMIIGGAFLGNALGQESWTVKSPIPALNNVIWAGTQFVAVGNEGTILTSADGISWIRKNSGTMRTLNTVAWTGSKIVVSGDSVIATSTDGTTWTVTTLPFAGNISAMAWTGAKLVAVGRDIYTSPDGVTWAHQLTGVNLRSVAYANNIIVAFGPEGINTSPDGITWTTRDSKGSYFTSVIWAGTQFVAAAGDSVFVSANGTAWSHKPLIKAVNYDLEIYALAWTGTQIIAAGRGQSSMSISDGIFTSPDAINWTMRKAPIPYRSDIASITSSPTSQIVAIGGGTILSSTDGIAWVSRTSSIAGSFTSIARTSDKWVISSESAILSSPDASAWSMTIGPPGYFNWYTSMFWTGSQLVFTKRGSQINSLSGGALFTSPDGTNWKQCITNVPSLNGFASTGNTIVAVGYLGTILTSADGNTWIYRNSGTYSTLNAIAWTGTQYVAVGEYSIILTSPDGISWTRRYVSQLNTLNYILWTGSQLVAIGKGGSVITSPNGITWTIQNSGTTADLYGISGTATRMAAVGGITVIDSNGTYNSLGIILSSRDGVAWTKQTTGTTSPLRAIAYADSQFIAVGDNGTVLSSPLATGVTTPLAKSTAHAFFPHLSRAGISVDLAAGPYALSIIDMSGRVLYSSSGTVASAGRRIFNPAVTTNCCILKLRQNGTTQAKKVMMVN